MRGLMNWRELRFRFVDCLRQVCGFGLVWLFRKSLECRGVDQRCLRTLIAYSSHLLVFKRSGEC